MRRCDQCQEPTDAQENLEGEILCSDECQREYGITSLLALMNYPPETKLVRRED